MTRGSRDYPTPGAAGRDDPRLRDGAGRPGGRAARRGRAAAFGRRATAPGGVHHVAFRTPDAAYQRLGRRACGRCACRTAARSTASISRALYFREPNGILFEIATDGPGFAADEPLETLGERLSLPPFLEARRAAIEANLKPL